MLDSTKIKQALASQQGFTLLEVLIAIGITALIGLGAWQVLNSAITSSDRTQVHLEELNQIQKAMLIVKRDLSQVIGRSIRDEYGDYQNALDSSSDFYKIQFSRVGWRNPLDDKRSEIQRVAYELDSEKLVRHYWTALDQTQDSESIRKTLLNDIESLDFRFLNESDAWVGKWPVESLDSETTSPDPRQTNNSLPKAIEIEIAHKRFGKVKRLFEVGSYFSGKELELSGGASSDNGLDGQKAKD
ncbi:MULTISPECIES: type II secretion system minor pseudopilin GspJ [unclassified Oleiphilus]|jgi:general secretion pathway protein J|uniref:type II secretion system minor pseudopilin GspJ n=5 Tax=Oleiphilus TaxID=141450 RepID=UPI0007C26E70|nr:MULTISPECIES: type II secretion system minor pseudopilin GspJ [unclassified Oleiphilus]KZY43593.1 hypothetical protein A3732_14025 [Oleiphilus sp. HI0050]KZY74474.1 hypothetical protein A3740_16470 [Oleiphilus sp. HI0068]KZY80978.1 hypothetical protein A3741_05025 [Oleiphilus sp. HI0069]KZZ19784.1 hypothetical protein A3752_13455 [Oleiphilus sp. HI0081]KZZ31044.1 hypothetical protein A3755_12700 [Oleiphilus sp. HI0085]